MPTPTFAQLGSGLQAFVRLLEEGRKFAEANTRNVVDDVDALAATIVTDYPDLYGAGMLQLRGTMDAYLRAGDQFFAAWLRDYGRFLDLPAGADVAFIFDRVYDDFITNVRRVRRRNFTPGTPTANGSNAGNGTIRRLSVDAEGFRIESGRLAGRGVRLLAEAKAARCVVDANSGAARRGEELFEFRGADAARDALETLGSGRRLLIASTHSRSSLLLNPSFDGRGGTDAAPTSITNWSSTVVVSAANVRFDATNVYLPARNASETIRSLDLRASQTVAQRLDVGGRPLNPRSAYYCQVAWNRSVGAASGTLVLRMGGASNSVAVAGQAGWQILRAVASEGASNWFENFNRERLAVQLGWTRNTGNLLLDDVIFTTFAFGFDGHGYIVSPSSTPFLARAPGLRTGDEFTWTDTESSSVAVLQNWLDRKGLGYLPHSATPTLADP